MRIIVDTNVFVGAVLRSGGMNRAVLRACLLRKVTPLFGVALFHEYEDLMHRHGLMQSCSISKTDRQALFESLLSVSEWVRIYYLWRPNLPDESDNHLVELALAGGADAIVTNNVRDLKRGELSFPSLRILTPRQFMEDMTWQH